MEIKTTLNKDAKNQKLENKKNINTKTSLISEKRLNMQNVAEFDG